MLFSLNVQPLKKKKQPVLVLVAGVVASRIHLLYLFDLFMFLKNIYIYFT